MATANDILNPKVARLFERTSVDMRLRHSDPSFRTADPLLLANLVAVSSLRDVCLEHLGNIQDSTSREPLFKEDMGQETFRQILASMLIATSIPRVSDLDPKSSMTPDFISQANTLADKMIGIASLLHFGGSTIALPRFRIADPNTLAVLVNYAAVLTTGFTNSVCSALGSLDKLSVKYVQDSLYVIWQEIWDLLLYGIRTSYDSVATTVYAIPDIWYQISPNILIQYCNSSEGCMIWDLEFNQDARDRSVADSSEIDSSEIDSPEIDSPQIDSPEIDSPESASVDSDSLESDLGRIIRVPEEYALEKYRIPELIQLCTACVPYKKILQVSFRSQCSLPSARSTYRYGFEFDQNLFVNQLRQEHNKLYEHWHLALLFEPRQNGIRPTDYEASMLTMDRKSWSDPMRLASLQCNMQKVLTNELGMDSDDLAFVEAHTTEITSAIQMFSVKDMLSSEDSLPGIFVNLRNILVKYIAPRDIMPVRSALTQEELELKKSARQAKMASNISAFGDTSPIDGKVSGDLGLAKMAEDMFPIEGVSFSSSQHVPTSWDNQIIFNRSIIHMLSTCTWQDLQVSSPRSGRTRIQEFKELSHLIFESSSKEMLSYGVWGDNTDTKGRTDRFNQEADKDSQCYKESLNYIERLIIDGVPLEGVISHILQDMYEVVNSSTEYVRSIYDGKVSINSEEELIDSLAEFITPINVLKGAIPLPSKILSGLRGKAYSVWDRYCRTICNGKLGYTTPRKSQRCLSVYSSEWGASDHAGVHLHMLNHVNAPLALKVYSTLLAPVHPVDRLEPFQMFLAELCRGSTLDKLLLTRGADSTISRLTTTFKKLLYEAVHEAMLHTFSPKRYTVSLKDFIQFCELQATLKDLVFPQGTTGTERVRSTSPLAGLRDYDRAKFAREVTNTSPISMALLDKYAIFWG